MVEYKGGDGDEHEVFAGPDVEVISVNAKS